MTTPSTAANANSPTRKMPCSVRLGRKPVSFMMLEPERMAAATQGVGSIRRRGSSGGVATVTAKLAVALNQLKTLVALGVRQCSSNSSRSKSAELRHCCSSRVKPQK